MVIYIRASQIIDQQFYILILNELGHQDVSIMISPSKSKSRGHTWINGYSNTPTPLF